MLYFSLTLADYDEDNFSMPINAGNIGLFCRMAWPTEIQKLYDDQIVILNTQFKSISFFSLLDPNGIQHLGFSFELIESWKQFIIAWESGDQETISLILNSAPWPYDLKADVLALKTDPTNSSLYNEIKVFITNMQPILDDIAKMDELLIWSIIVEYQGVEKVSCVNPNVWLFQGEPDYHLCFYTLQDRITRNDLSQVQLYIAVGDGDI